MRTARERGRTARTDKAKRDEINERKRLWYVLRRHMADPAAYKRDARQLILAELSKLFFGQ